ncbi:TIGR02281 family clan AA aspartic protease [Novosphingobium sp. BL-8H]|uniref:retropepsin-like aspartic protease family protein n=1 Tax=Novosphingobium sp. BL-8H TaxID=3127640 RepID=UPI003756AB7E
MNKGLLIPAIIAIGVTVLTAPGHKAGQGTDQSAAAASPHRKAATAAWFAGNTELTRAADGHFYADAAVNQHSTRFLIDTGASMVALTGADARAIGLDWSDSDVIPIGQGASGPVYGVPVRLERIELGGTEVRDVRAAIVPEGLDVSLLGQSFLSRVGNVRIEGERMMLGAD